MSERMVPRGLLFPNAYTNGVRASLQAIRPASVRAHQGRVAMALFAAKRADDPKLDVDQRLEWREIVNEQMAKIGSRVEIVAPPDKVILDMWDEWKRFHPESDVFKRFTREDIVAELEADKTAETAAHECGHIELRTSRMQLALQENNAEAYELLASEIGNCVRCWEAVSHWTNNKLAGVSALVAGGNDKAADVVAGELARLLS